MIAGSKRVLVLDDEDVVCRSFERVLHRAGFGVATAHNGREALAQVADGRCDLMLADLKMPGMDGLAVVRQVRQTHPDLPVIVITGYPSQDTLHEAAQLGVADYLTKPVPPDLLTHAANQALTMSPGGTAAYLTAPRCPSTAMPLHFPVTAPVPPLWEVEPQPPPRVDRLELPADIVAPAAAPVVVPAARPMVVDPAGAAKPIGPLRAAIGLAGGLVLSLAYVVFLPFAGFAVMVVLGAKTVWRKLVRRRE